MNKGWTTTRLLTAGSFGVLIFVIALFEAGIVTATGLALTGGVIGALIEPVIRLLCCHVIDRFGAATLMGLVLGLLALPISYMGPPGFLPKVLTQIIGGLCTDILYLILKRNRKIASPIIGGINRIVYLALIIFIGRLFEMPGIEQSVQAFSSFVVIGGAVMMGIVGGWLGWVIYSRIENTNLVTRIQAN